MDMTGEAHLPADKAQVWAALNDPDMLKSCIPGCEQFEATGENSYAALAVAKIGPVKAKFKGLIELSEIDAPHSYVISGQGDGGIAGFAKGRARVRLDAAEAGGTVLSYEVEAQIGGKLAQLGQRLVNGVAKSYADKFFVDFARKLTGEEAEPAAPPAENAP